MRGLTEGRYNALILAGRFASVVACLVFGAIMIPDGPAAQLEGRGPDRDIQYTFALVAASSTVAAWRWPMIGGSLLVLTGTALGVATAARYSQETAAAAALLFATPGLLFLSSSVRQRPAWLQFAMGGAVLSVIAIGILLALDTHGTVFGPAHPQSALVRQPYDRVEWVWSGAVTPTGVTVNARIVGPDAARVRLVVSTEPSFGSPRYSDYMDVEPADNGIVSLRTEGLAPSTRYHYALEVDGVLDTQRTGGFQTFPDGPATFSILLGSCARTGSNGLVFDAMRTENALLYINTGDFHYENIVRDDEGAFRRAYDAQLTSPAQAALYQQTPIAYVWDDHDFGGNNSNSSSRASEAARLTYRLHVPHYELPAGPGDAAIYQAFSIGRVRFVMTDTRSMRDLEKMEDGARSLLGSAQRGWLKRELREGSLSHEVVVWVNSVPWIAPAGSGRDDWGGYATERAEIANFIAENGISNLVMLSGDAHMLAIDDGTNTDYSSRGGGGFPLLQAGALDRPGSVKGGPYSEGAYPGAGQYGLVTFRDVGDTMTVELSGRNWQREEIVGRSFTIPRPEIQ